ncbi:MAG: cobalamin-binding protein [Candidatus Saganbacteria bacterium]|nr:cobalamin-binding protein [Candidatus Saganbacteria bacterium]
MSRIVPFILLIVLLLSGIPSFAYNRITYPLTVTDESGGKLKLTKAPERIISCMPSITEMLFAMGLEGKIAGVTEHCNYPEAAKKITKVGRDKMNIEAMVNLKPDLVVMLGSAQADDIRKARKFGLPVYVIDPKSVNGIMFSFNKLGTATGRPNASYSVNERMKRKLDWIAVRIKQYRKRRPSVFVEIWHRPLTSASGGTFIDDVIRLSGGINIAREAKGEYPQFSIEKLIKIDPDAIIIPEKNIRSQAEIYNDFMWSKLKAVKNKKVLFIDADIISRPGPRVVSAIEKIMEFIYSEGTSIEAR